jgi:ribonuclease PH
MIRHDGRKPDELRPVHVVPHFVSHPEGSVLISVGDTRVLCNATIEENIPRWMQTQGKPGGWITAEYSMLPRSTHTRSPREIRELSGRTQEIRRLIGRSLRAAINLELLGPRTIILDCDVIQADGGTRTASITGGYLALAIALHRYAQKGLIPLEALQSPVAAVSVGIADGLAVLDLDYKEDSQAEVDFNIVMNGMGQFIEVQGTAEGKSFSRASLDELLELATKGIAELFVTQQAILAQIGIS